MTQREKLYAKRDAMALDEAGNYYINHVMAMGSEQLHSKSAIASELAHRDMLIDKLTKELQAAKAQPQWIPVSERLPENNSGIYLCSGHEGTKFICHRRNNEWIRSPQMKRVVGITHWMPLPELPEAVK